MPAFACGLTAPERTERQVAGPDFATLDAALAAGGAQRLHLLPQLAANSWAAWISAVLVGLAT